jgi:DNA-binding transcriptional regulator YbjK
VREGGTVARLSSAQRRTELVQAALRVIDRKGVHAATTRAIVAEAGMPLASFHYAVSSRDELIRDVIAAVLDNERTATLGSLRPGSDIRSTLRSGFQAYFDLLVSAPGHEQALFELLHYSLRTEELADLPGAQYAGYRATASELLRAAADHAGVHWAVPIDDVSRLLIALTDGLTLGWLADRDSEAAARTMDLAADVTAALARSTPPELA